MIDPTNTNLTCIRAKLRPRLIMATLPTLVLVCLLGPSLAAAQDEKLPKAETILDKYVEVTGGKAAYAKVKNRVTKSTLDIPAQGMKFNMTIYGARPNKMYILTESEALGKMEKGVDGKVAWEVNMMTGPQVKEAEERDLMLRMATFNAAVHWRKLYKKVECVGIETVNEKPCYKIVLTPETGDPETQYYDKESNLLVKTEMNLKLAMGTIPLESYSSDYKQIDGILFPHKAKALLMGTERIMTTESIEHNVKLPPDRFKLPAEIQELVDQQKKGEKTQPATP